MTVSYNFDLPHRIVVIIEMNCKNIFELIADTSTAFFLARDEANEILADRPGNREVRVMGWLSEQIQLPEANRPEWKPVFAALTDKDILLYDMVPLSCEDWANPYISHPLLATRYGLCLNGFHPLSCLVLSIS